MEYWIKAIDTLRSEPGVRENDAHCSIFTRNTYLHNHVATFINKIRARLMYNNNLIQLACIKYPVTIYFLDLCEA